MSDQMRAPSNGEVVYGEVDHYLVFIPRERAVELASIHQALWSSATWGEFRSRIPRHDYAQILEAVEHRISFEEFCKWELEHRPGLSHEEARRAYKELPIRDRRPEDDHRFSVDHIPFVYDGDWPDWPAQQMLYWVPEEIQREFGTLKASCFNGYFLTFDPAREREMAAAFETFGYHCIRDDPLAQEASGRGE